MVGCGLASRRVTYRTRWFPLLEDHIVAAKLTWCCKAAQVPQSPTFASTRHVKERELGHKREHPDVGRAVRVGWRRACPQGRNSKGCPGT